MLEDLEARPEVWEGEAWLAGVSVGELVEEVIALAVAEVRWLQGGLGGQPHFVRIAIHNLHRR